ncbi:MAG: DUF3822 family protein [Bacteroidales bacterium]|nr:DUF3822 family protein [Bacteroidales bacterium]
MPLPTTSKASAQYIDRDFQPDFTKNNRLSIQLRLDGFSFAQIDSISNKVLFVEDYKVPLMLGEESVFQNEKVNLRLENFLAEKQIHQKGYKSVHFVIDNPYFALVPSILLEASQVDDYLRQLHQIPENFLIKTDEISFFNSKNVYGIYAPLLYNLTDHFSSFVIKHASTIFIQQMALLQKMRKGEAVYIEVGLMRMQIIAFDGDKLVFSNSFAFKEKEDFIYFILLVYNQLNFKPETTPLFFSGNIDRSSPLYAIAYQYIGILDFPKPQLSGLVFGSDIPESVGLKYRVLTQAVVCE